MERLILFIHLYVCMDVEHSLYFHHILTHLAMNSVYFFLLGTCCEYKEQKEPVPEGRKKT